MTFLGEPSDWSLAVELHLQVPWMIAHVEILGSLTILLAPSLVIWLVTSMTLEYDKVVKRDTGVEHPNLVSLMRCLYLAYTVPSGSMQSTSLEF
jgi:hypothetical protein